MMENRRIKRVILIAVTVIVTACSFQNLYNQLDHLIPGYVAGIVTLDEALEEALDQRAVLLIRWHRNTQLRQYADWLHRVQKDVGPTLTEDKVIQYTHELNAFWRVLAEKLNTEMAELLPLLSEEQQLEMQQNLQHKNEQFREKYIGLKEKDRIEAYAERLQAQYERWLGRLTDEQLRAVQQAAQKIESSAEQRLLRRQGWQKGVREILSSQDSRPQKTERLKVFLSGFVDVDSEAMKASSAFNTSLIARLTVHMAHGMTAKQKAHFMAKTDEYIRMFTNLAKDV